MTQFEKEFIVKCLSCFITILSYKEELDKAIVNFSKKDRNNPRYQLNSAIPESEQWTLNDRINFSAAVFEATVQITIIECTNPDLIAKVSHATTLWRTQYVPLLAANTDPNNRLKSFKANCDGILLTLAKEPVAEQIQEDHLVQPLEFEPEQIQEEYSTNPYLFFGTIILGISAATVAALVLPKR